MLGTVWHTLNIKVFGDGLFGWKMGALTAIAVALPPFYWLLRQTFGVRVAIFGTMSSAPRTTSSRTRTPATTTSSPSRRRSPRSPSSSPVCGAAA